MSDPRSNLALMEIDSLTQHEADVLAFEALGWPSRDRKAQAVHDAWEVSLTRYEQWLAAIIDNGAALQAHPVMVNRLRRLREQRWSARSARLLLN